MTDDDWPELCRARVPLPSRLGIILGVAATGIAPTRRDLELLPVPEGSAEAYLEAVLDAAAEVLELRAQFDGDRRAWSACVSWFEVLAPPWSIDVWSAVPDPGRGSNSRRGRQAADRSPDARVE